MHVRIVKVPTGKDAELFDVTHMCVGEIRDVGPRMAAFLLSCGYAEPYEHPERRAIAADRAPKPDRSRNS